MYRSSSKRVLLADMSPKMRSGLRTLIKRDDALEIVGESGSGAETVEMVRRLVPDLVILELKMGDQSGLEVARTIASSWPDTKMLAVSMFPDRRYAQAMLQAGASGYLVKNHAHRELAGAIEATFAGRVFLSPELSS